ncbi:polysaccharide biosynthesis protein [Paenibacillus sp. SI8]|uniref:polysaccharide biosynthesis protein n=1 Tax=unclassified Paenibacillus TaxID=185978 RepID=UPI0034670239
MRKISKLVMVDIILVAVSIYTTYYFHYETSYIKENAFELFWYFMILSATLIGVSYYLNLYNRVWLYASIGEVISILKSTFISALASYIIMLVVSHQYIPYAILIRNFETLLILVGGSRFYFRIFKDNYVRSSEVYHRVLIVGAGDCGSMVARELKSNKANGLYPVGFIDDDVKKLHQHVSGLPIFGNREDIHSVVKEQQITDIIIAIPSGSRKVISGIIEICKNTQTKLKIIPRLNDLIEGRVTVNEIRDVEVEDLLGRDPVTVDLEGIATYVTNKRVLVSGAGGSIGSELCRQIAIFNPVELIILGHGENSIYNISMELKDKFPSLVVESIIADVQDKIRIESIFTKYKPQVIFHAAAHKHVPLMEKNPSEAIKNNIFGTRNLVEAADRVKSEIFVLISTDKAVNPTSVMGATKRMAEMIIQSMDKQSETKFAAVRFGNVLGSRGSVIPRFKEQIMAGGPVTVTHPEMIRYFMTIPEAVQLVIQAGSLSAGGEVFILDMDKPVKIVDLAKDLIRLSGLEPNVDVDIEYSGIRPGEKLYEELLTSEEGLSATKHDRIFIGKPVDLSKEQIDLEVSRLEQILKTEVPDIRLELAKSVPSFQSVS